MDVTSARALILLFAGAAACAHAQVSSENQRDGAASVTLDQLPSVSRQGSTEPGTIADLDAARRDAVSASDKVTSIDLAAAADGREVVMPSLKGSDRCDPKSRTARTPLCRRRIETRASDYSRPRASPVTPEARLLLLMTPGNSASSDPTGGKTFSASGLNSPNGPAEQIAGALRDGTIGQGQVDTGKQPDRADQNALPNGVPPIVILPK